MRSALFKILSPFASVVNRFRANALTVLAYHDVRNAPAFENQIRYLKQHYSIISLQQLISFIEQGVALPARPLLITFDDGDLSVFEKALPVLEKFQAPAVLFIITGLIGTNEAFWWKRVEAHARGKGKSFFEARGLVREMKQKTNQERLLLLESMKPVNQPQLTIQQLTQLKTHSIDIANHTDSHPMLNLCTDAEITAEMERSKLFFKKLGFGYFHVFAYPNGNNDERTESRMKQSGIRLAFLFDHRLNHIPVDPMRISRIMVDADLPMDEFKVRISGLHGRLIRKFR